MSTVQSKLGRITRRTFETSSMVILIVLLALPFTRAFADDYRFGRGGPVFYGATTVEGWRLGGAYRGGGYEIWRWYRGDWRRMPGRGVQLGGNPRSPWVINSQGERYKWTGRDWRFTGYASGRGVNRRNFVPAPVYRNNRGSNRWFDNRGYRNDRYNDRRIDRRNDRRVVRQQRNRIERQQDRIQDLRQDLRRERVEDRREDRRDRVRDRRDDRRERARDRREDRGDRVQDRRENRREGRPGNNGRPNRDEGPRNGPR